jgi:DNA-binding response OmpR family regulator
MLVNLLHRILNSSSEKACAGTAILSIMHILLVEDDHKAARLLARGLEEEGYAVTVAHSAEEASHHALSRFDMAILDWMMPGKDGVTVCTEWRADGQTLPVLMLTARDAVADRITGLNTGADDYLTKPFVFDELLARVRALLRRVERVQPPAALQVADLLLDLRSRAVTRAGAKLDLDAQGIRHPRTVHATYGRGRQPSAAGGTRLARGPDCHRQPDGRPHQKPAPQS